MSATYTKLKDGSWGIRIDGTATAGQSITVTKKSGDTKAEKISRVLWSGKDAKSGKNVSLCSIAQSGSSSGHGAKPGTCVNCGASCNPRYRRCLDCVDGGGNAHGGMSYYDRNGNFVLGDDD